MRLADVNTNELVKIDFFHDEHLEVELPNERLWSHVTCLKGVEEEIIFIGIPSSEDEPESFTVAYYVEDTDKIDFLLEKVTSFISFVHSLRQ